MKIFFLCGSALPVHDAQHLFANVLSSAQRAGLNEVLVAPGVGELVVLPGVVDGQQGQVVSLWLVELGLLLVSQRLLVLEHKYGNKKCSHAGLDTVHI